MNQNNVITDLELAIKFFTAIKNKGFKLNFNSEAYGESIQGEPAFMSIEILDAYGISCCQFDFSPNGDFYRISAFNSDGGWNDEVDWNKY